MSTIKFVLFGTIVPMVAWLFAVAIPSVLLGGPRRRITTLTVLAMVMGYFSLSFPTASAQVEGAANNPSRPINAASVDAVMAMPRGFSEPAAFVEYWEGFGDGYCMDPKTPLSMPNPNPDICGEGDAAPVSVPAPVTVREPEITTIVIEPPHYHPPVVEPPVVEPPIVEPPVVEPPVVEPPVVEPPVVEEPEAEIGNPGNTREVGHAGEDPNGRGTMPQDNAGGNGNGEHGNQGQNGGGNGHRP